MQELILHHYEGSPFAEKVVRALAFKGLPWRSVEIPVVLPRPDYVTLTGGYRRSPILQIGADIICDTNLILRILERIKPEPTLNPEGSETLSYAISHWFEPKMFLYAGPVRFQSPDDVDSIFKGKTTMAAFGADRRPFTAPLMETSRLPEYLPAAIAHIREYVAFIDDQIGNTGAFLCGETPAHADFSAFHPLWWLSEAPNRLRSIADSARVESWIDRLSSFPGVGSQPMTSGEALKVARECQPDSSLLPKNSEFRTSDETTKFVSVVPSDYGADPVEGELAYQGRDHVVIRRKTQNLGTVTTHFPQWGYDIRRISET